MHTAHSVISSTAYLSSMPLATCCSRQTSICGPCCQRASIGHHLCTVTLSLQAASVKTFLFHRSHPHLLACSKKWRILFRPRWALTADDDDDDGDDDDDDARD